MLPLAHVLGQAGRGRLLTGELVGRLRAVAQRQRGVQIQIGRLLDPLDQVVAVGNRSSASRALLGVAHVALQQRRRWPG